MMPLFISLSKKTFLVLFLYRMGKHVKPTLTHFIFVMTFIASKFNSNCEEISFVFCVEISFMHFIGEDSRIRRTRGQAASSLVK